EAAAGTIGAAGPDAELDARNQDGEVLHVPAIERQLDNAAVIDDGAGAGVFRIEEYGVGRDLDRFDDAANIQPDVLAGLERRFDADAADDLGLKALSLDPDIVVSDLEQRKSIVAGLVGRGG